MEMLIAAFINVETPLHVRRFQRRRNTVNSNGGGHAIFSDKPLRKPGFLAPGAPRARMAVDF